MPTVSISWAAAAPSSPKASRPSRRPPTPPSTGPSSSDAPGSGFRVLVPIECDVTSPSSISAAAAQIEREKGFDALINNAGMIGPVHTDFNDAQTVTELQGVLLKD